MVSYQDIKSKTSSENLHMYDADGSGDATYRYSDFGETTVQGENQAGNEVCYTGGIYDSTTGLYYLNVRYYFLADEICIVHSTINQRYS